MDFDLARRAVVEATSWYLEESAELSRLYVWHYLLNRSHQSLPPFLLKRLDAFLRFDSPGSPVLVLAPVRRCVLRLHFVVSGWQRRFERWRRTSPSILEVAAATARVLDKAGLGPPVGLGVPGSLLS